MSEFEALLCGILSPSMPSKLIKKELFNGVKQPKFQFGEDIYIMLQLFYFAKNIEYVSKPFFNYNKLNQSSLTTKITKQTILDIKDMNLAITTFLRDKGIYDKFIKFHRIRLVSIVFYYLNDNLLSNLKSIDKEAAKFKYILENKKFSILKKLVCILPFVKLEWLFKFIRDLLKR